MSRERRKLPVWMMELCASEMKLVKGEPCKKILRLNSSENCDVKKNTAVDTYSKNCDKEEERPENICDPNSVQPPCEHDSDTGKPAEALVSTKAATNISELQGKIVPLNSSPSKDLNNEKINAPGISENSSSCPDTQAQFGAANSTRQSCYYGSSCYRKNPQHQVEFAHPGDLDYSDRDNSSFSNDVSDNRPLCNYGSSCYRKNTQHRQDFRHDAPARVQDLSPKFGDSTDIDSDESASEGSEFNDSFITTDSMSSGNGDYCP